MLTDTEFKDLEERLINGKKCLEGKWGARDWETKQWISLWFGLSDTFVDEYNTRVARANKKVVSERKWESADEHLEYIRQQMISNKLIKNSTERRVKKNDQSRSDGIRLFESS